MWQEVEGRFKAVSEELRAVRTERESLVAELEKLRAERVNRIARVQQLEKQLARSREDGEAKDENFQKLQIEINEVCSPLSMWLVLLYMQSLQEYEP